MSPAQKQIALFRPKDISDALTLLMMSFPGAAISFRAYMLFENHISHFDIVVRTGPWPWNKMEATYTPTT
jgi:hypothetical protein